MNQTTGDVWTRGSSQSLLARKLATSYAAPGRETERPGFHTSTGPLRILSRGEAAASASRHQRSAVHVNLGEC
jgi:hypothetical protein